MASLAECGQQTPIIVVLCAENRERYLVIDGHKRIAALQQLGRDTVEATVWAMSEAEALLLERSLRPSPQESAGTAFRPRAPLARRGPGRGDSGRLAAFWHPAIAERLPLYPQLQGRPDQHRRRQRGNPD